MSHLLRPFLLSLCLLASAFRAHAAPVRIIYDTDMQTDCDDVAALAALHALADLGEVEILATMICVLNPWAAPCTDAINTYYGRPHIPLGQLKGSDGVNRASTYAQGIAQGFPQDTGSAANAPDATPLYRQLLANEPDQSVVILSVGYMTNLAKLMNSPADAISPLTGAQLIQQKVKLWICMGGNFPDDYLKTAESDNVNFRRHPASVIDCVTNWPGPIVFVGREIGHSMRAGQRLDQTPITNPVRRAYELFFGGSVRDQHCADIAAVLYAVRGLADYWDMHSTGSMEFTNQTAHFRWVATPDKDQEYLLQKMAPTVIQELLEDLFIQPPGSGQPRPTAAITSPAPGSKFAEGAPITITATGTDTNGTIAKVEFFDGFKKIGESTAAPFSIQWSSTVPGAHRLSAKVTDNDFGSTISDAVTITIGQTLEGNGTGLTGEYFDNPDLTNSKLTRVDATVNFSWGTGSPDPSIAADSFSVRWTGAVQPMHVSGSQAYTIYTNTNDGVRLWINEQLVIDDWNAGPLRENSAVVNLTAGMLHSLKIEFFENTNTAQAELRWESASIPKQVVPVTQLFPQTNQPPAAGNDAASTDQELPVSIAVLANDSDPDLFPGPLRIESVSGGAAGSNLEIVGALIVYTPAPNFVGTDTFSYVVGDGQATASGSVSVEVLAWTTFEPFLRKYFTTEEQADPSISGWLADPDQDGLTNAVEYAQFTDPRSPNTWPSAPLELRNGHLVLTYVRRKGATDHTARAQVSGDLLVWESGPSLIEETIASEDILKETVEARDLTPVAQGTRRFMRLQIIQP